MKTTLGGDRLGSGNKQEISMRNYERSTHDIGYIWRSSMASGTLVPFLSELALSGDSFDIDLNANVMTLPTNGPLFGSYKVQLDVFQAPVRLYQGKLHMNKLGIGMKMADVKLPQLQLRGRNPLNETDIKDIDNYQVNSSSIFSYLNIRGLGMGAQGSASVTRLFNALPYLSYWDIYKQYYSNKQEEEGVVIHNPMDNSVDYGITFAVMSTAQDGTKNILGPVNAWDINVETALNIQVQVGLDAAGIGAPDVDAIEIELNGNQFFLTDVFTNVSYREATRTVDCTGWIDEVVNGQVEFQIFNQVVDGQPNPDFDGPPQLTRFKLENIDKMRENILKAVSDEGAYTILATAEEPYGLPLKEVAGDGKSHFSVTKTQEGLACKTYQSDLFNNWISTEWIDGPNGINEVTKVSTTGDAFTIDALNLANKVYNMLNRIAISGGTYDDWLDAVYTHERQKSVESPIYHGGLIKELSFEEVVSTAASQTEQAGDVIVQPLGELAGRGRLTNKNKGGKIKIKVDEPSYIIGIVSITPRIDYSQGNKWDVNLKTMDDFHKPALDEIGYQDLVTDQMAWFDTICNIDQTLTFKSAGKQPAWINYMTNVNQVRGTFAEKNNQMWMTLNRRYEYDSSIGITDLTTYIDPSKYNYIWADGRLDAMNFWTQIGINITARRKMSAKVIPNL